MFFRSYFFIIFPDPFYFFQSFDLFQSTWLVLAGPMASPNGENCGLPNEVCDITNCVAIYYAKDVRAGMPSIGKKSSEPRLSRNVETFKALKETVKCVRRPSPEYRNNHFFTGTWTKENKTISKPFTERNVIVICSLIC